MTDLEIFCRQVRDRSREDRIALEHLWPARTVGVAIGLLRQELDSMVRVIFLLSTSDRARRSSLIADAVAGRAWRQAGGRGRITDAEMVKVADSLHGWTRSVYRFGCAFIHLSSFHDYNSRDPLSSISADERSAILEHMRYYHGGPAEDHPTFRDLAVFIPRVFEKIASNLEHYVRELERDADLAHE